MEQQTVGEIEQVKKRLGDRLRGVRKVANEQDVGDAPSDRQKAYITHLASTMGVRLNLDAIRDKEHAARLIDSLKRRAGIGMGDERDRKVAFGMATKLVYQRHVARYGEVRVPEQFWLEVDRFYREYQRRQGRAIALSSFSTSVKDAPPHHALQAF